MRLSRWTQRESDGPWWHDGRAYCTLWNNAENRHGGAGIELLSGKRVRFWGFQFKLGGKHSEKFLSGMFGLPKLFAFYWNIETPRSWFRFSPKESKELQLLFHDLDSVSVRLWKHDDMTWRASDKWWQRMHWYINLERLFWGKGERTEEIVKGPVDVNVPMPEAFYPATVTITKRVWRYRFTKTITEYGYTLDFKDNGYLPVPGKGSAAYNCGPDGIFGESGPGRTVADAVAGVVGSALNERLKYGASLDYAEPIS